MEGLEEEKIEENYLDGEPAAMKGRRKRENGEIELREMSEWESRTRVGCFSEEDDADRGREVETIGS